jgi:hypothetical protein
MMATLANSAWLASCVPEYLHFRKALSRVREEQERVLHQILRRNQASRFGRSHAFSTIRTVRDYRERVPLRDYEDYRPLIDRIAQGEPRVLTREPVRLFEPTSGSAGEAKWIPYTASLQVEFQRAIRAWVADLFRSDLELLRGPAYWSVSPAHPSAEVTPSGIPVAFADDSEYVGGLGQRLVRSVMAVPSSVRHLRDVEAFWYATLLHLVRRPDLRFISVWSPSFLTLLMDRLEQHRERLLRDEPRLRPALNAATAAERHARLWPHLRIISCWTDGNSAAAARRMAALFPQAQIRGKGLIATEGFISLPWTASGGNLLAVRSHFLEFLPADSDGRSDDSRPQLAHELEAGQDYSVVLTTGGGLYRYRLGDLIAVTGRVQQCPAVRFMGRQRVVDWCGEKLHEAHVARVLESALRAHGCAPAFAMLACDASNTPPHYVLYLEAGAGVERLCEIGASIERGLEENFHYRYARRLGQLCPLRVFRARNAEAAYVAACCARGRRAGSVKSVALDPDGGWTAKFEGGFVELEHVS